MSSSDRVRTRLLELIATKCKEHTIEIQKEEEEQQQQQKDLQQALLPLSWSSYPSTQPEQMLAPSVVHSARTAAVPKTQVHTFCVHTRSVLAVQAVVSVNPAV